MEFGIISKEFKVADKDLRLRPLSGRFIKPFYTIMEALSSKDMQDDSLSEEAKNELMLKKLGSDGVSEKLHLLAFETMKKSYPKENIEGIEDFVSANLMSFIDPLLKLNLPQGE